MPKRKINYHEHDTPPLSQLPDTSPAASAQECTGLMPSPPDSPEELLSYQQLSPMAIPKEREAGKSAQGKKGRK